MPTNDVKLLIVDDSSIVRQVLSRELDAQPGITVVGAAPDPYAAREMIVSEKPDVLTLDIEMPRMDGLTFLRKLMRFHPMPTIIVSSLTPTGCDMTLACLDAGAVDVVAKPNESYSIGDLSRRLGELIRGVSKINLDRALKRAKSAASNPQITSDALLDSTHKIIALGASTGGTEAIRTVLSHMPRTCPGIVMTQHMPPGFTKTFADRLDQQCAIDVREAVHGDWVVPGLALLAPGDQHMQLVRDGAQYKVRLMNGPLVCGHKPSIEVLFNSVAKYAGRNGIGAIMTGMGADGAEGLLTLRNAGGRTVAQDEASCVVYGMPRVAAELNAAESICSLDDIGAEVLKFATKKKRLAS